MPVVATDPQTLDPLEETPEWEPHAAARDTPEEVIPAESLEVDQPAFEEEAPPEDVWADPTPTAMSDAAALDEEAASAPEEETASFSSLVEDEPFATAGTATAEAEDPFASGEDEVAAAPEVEAASPEETAEASSVAMADAPEEEPFERAGRWWFKRGSELLVYNEQSGEWVPSPTPLPGIEQSEPSRYGRDTSVTQTITDLTAVSADEPTTGAEEEREPSIIESTGQQGFWRCPACGAVNGSTSESCRMCFAERPAS